MIDFDKATLEEIDEYFRQALNRAIHKSHFFNEVDAQSRKQKTLEYLVEYLSNLDDLFKPHYSLLLQKEIHPDLEYISSCVEVESGFPVLRIKATVPVAAATINMKVSYDK